MKKIIVIDDDPVINFICKKFIQHLAPEIEVIGFTNPIEAFNYLKKYNKKENFPILLDLNMPEMSGWEFLDKCNKNNFVYEFFILSSSI
ncbi:MAG: response regulator, partial [Candidatus Sericytochromatia bacterium]